jgi:hypothetical protein
MSNNLSNITEYHIIIRARTSYELLYHTIFLTQITPKFLIQYNLTVNIQYFAFFKVSNRKEIQLLYAEVGGMLDKEEFYDLLHKATSEAYQFFFIDTRAKTTELMFVKNLTV